MMFQNTDDKKTLNLKNILEKKKKNYTTNVKYFFFFFIITVKQYYDTTYIALENQKYKYLYLKL